MLILDDNRNYIYPVTCFEVVLDVYWEKRKILILSWVNHSIKQKYGSSTPSQLIFVSHKLWMQHTHIHTYQPTEQITETQWLLLKWHVLGNKTHAQENEFMPNDSSSKWNWKCLTSNDIQWGVVHIRTSRVAQKKHWVNQKPLYWFFWFS